MNETQRLLQPAECGMVLVDFQAGLAFGVESASRQVLVNNALARTAVVFGDRIVRVIVGAYDGARAIVETNGGGYGIGLAYARDMIHPG